MANFHVIGNRDQEPFDMANVIRDIDEKPPNGEMEERNPPRLASPNDMETKRVVGLKRLQRPTLGYMAKEAQTQRIRKRSKYGAVETVQKGPVVEAVAGGSMTDEISAHSAASKVDDDTKMT